MACPIELRSNASGWEEGDWNRLHRHSVPIETDRRIGVKSIACLKSYIVRKAWTCISGVGKWNQADTIWGQAWCLDVEHVVLMGDAHDDDPV